MIKACLYEMKTHQTDIMSWSRELQEFGIGEIEEKRLGCWKTDQVSCTVHKSKMRSQRNYALWDTVPNRYH